MSLTVGTRLGPYAVADLVGAGGMREVYRARDTRLDRTVAVKVLPPAMLADAAARARRQVGIQAVPGRGTVRRGLPRRPIAGVALTCPAEGERGPL
jgi:hypothetical protein